MLDFLFSFSRWLEMETQAAHRLERLGRAKSQDRRRMGQRDDCTKDP